MTSENFGYRGNYDLVTRLECSRVQLESIKTHFEAVINSNRRFDNIKTLSQLLNVLEKRDYLNQDNITPLIDIAGLLNNPELADSLSSSLNNGNTNNYNTHSPVIYSRVLSQIPNNTKQRAYRLIVEELGAKWQDFARALGVRESKIDELGATHSLISNRIFEILRFHEENSPENLWRSQLLDALGDARRNDLRKEVQFIFDT